MRSLKSKIIAFIIGTTLVYFMIFYNFIKNDYSMRLSEKYKVDLENVVLHLDLKGAPPKLTYLKSLLPMFKRLGVTGILMEYEDMFPYEGRVVNASSRNCYDKAELQKFLIKAVEYDIEIIPLIQMFGHMEHVLKLQEFQHLREDINYPDSICPSNVESAELITEMVTQVILFHTRVTKLKHIHIGCDEVYNINKCQKCRRKNLTNSVLFTYSIIALRGIVLSLSPATTVLFWDDMLRRSNVKVQAWNNMSLVHFNQMEPVYWAYDSNLNFNAIHRQLYFYHKPFKNIWIASAFKGADGHQALLPDLKGRFNNHRDWMNFISNYKISGERKVFNFKGIILTGWSRYSHMDTLCELFPASLPSLVLNLILIQKYRTGVDISDTKMGSEEYFDKYISSKISRELKCEKPKNLFKESYVSFHFCKFQGSNLINRIEQFSNNTMEHINSVFTRDNLIFPSPEFYASAQSLNIYNVRAKKKWLKTNLIILKHWKKAMLQELAIYYDKYTVREYIDGKIFSIKKQLQHSLIILDSYTKNLSWVRRPKI